MNRLLPSLLTAFVLLTPSPADAAEKPLNVIVFLIDDMGAFDLGYLGSDLYKTPNIDRLAAEGMRFTRAYSACTVCSPTRAAMMTGKYPARLHLTDWIAGHKKPNAKLLPPEWTMYLKREETTVAEALKGAGYTTCHIGKWHLGNKEEGYPDQHGFDHNLGGYERGQPPSYFAPYKIPTLEEGPKGEYLTDREATEAIRFIEANRDKPFFLYLPHYAVHTPLQAKAELIEQYTKATKPDGRHKNARYAAMIHSLDQAVGRVLDSLRELKLEDRTLVVFTSDNGGLMSSTNNAPLRAGKGSAYEGGVRVPWIVRWPGVTPRGSVCDTPVMTIDLYPTILEATGHKGDAKHNASVDGVSLVPLLKDPKAKWTRDLFWHYPHYHPGGATPYSAIRTGDDWRMVEFYEDGHRELYNLAIDPSEKTDLAAMEPERVKDLAARLDAWRKKVNAQAPRPNPNAKP